MQSRQQGTQSGCLRGLKVPGLLVSARQQDSPLQRGPVRIPSLDGRRGGRAAAPPAQTYTRTVITLLVTLSKRLLQREEQTACPPHCSLSSPQERCDHTGQSSPAPSLAALLFRLQWTPAGGPPILFVSYTLHSWRAQPSRLLPFVGPSQSRPLRVYSPSYKWVPMTPSLGSMNLLKRLTKLREAFNRFIFIYLFYSFETGSH